MTIAELNRAIGSFNRVKRIEAQERATYDYLLADLIGHSIGRMRSASVTYPEISDVYPTLFDAEAIRQKKQEQKQALSALRFKQFAHSYNTRFEGGVKN